MRHESVLAPGLPGLEGRRAPASTPAGAEVAGRCAHCGEKCSSAAVVDAGLTFCCGGCHAIHRLLDEFGLGLESSAVRERPPIGCDPQQTREACRRWAHLDASGVEAGLLDFAEGNRARVTLRLPTIHCIGCVGVLENLFRLHPGIGESRVSYARREVRIAYDRSKLKLSELAALLASLGHEPELTLGDLGRPSLPDNSAWRKRQWLRLGVAGFAFGNIMLLALPGYLGLDSQSAWFQQLAGWLGLVLALPVVAYSASDYWRAAWRSLRHRVPSLDFPIALGLLAIYGQSVFEVVTGRGGGYSDSLTGLVFFLLCGRMFQRKTFDRLAFDLDYRSFFPLSALRRTVDGEEVAPVTELSPGDRLRVRHGELIPGDAVLVSGDALIDYGFVTGESAPQRRRVGESIHAGGRNQGGMIEVELTRRVSGSYLTGLWNDDSFHRDRDSDHDSQTQRYSGRFTRVILVIAVAAAVFWAPFDPGLSLKAFVSVLIVACPCALALAAPLVLGTAQRELARRRYHLRNAHVVERLAAVDTVVFDKTGTLTVAADGAAAWEGGPLSAAESVAVARLAGSSTHPLASRIARALRDKPATVGLRAFTESAGCGISGSVEARSIRLGSAVWLGVPPSPVPGTEVHLAIDGCHRGRFVFHGALRPGIEAMLRRLRDVWRVALLSGDNAAEGPRFRELLGGRTPLEFNQSPFDKLRAIGELQAAGRRVLMVGDGLNDAGALRRADVGAAVVENVGSFSPASDLIVDAACLERLPEVLAFCRRAARLVRVGFAVSGIYNVVGITIAATGRLSPLVCAILMPLSSATVVLLGVVATRWLGRGLDGAQTVTGREDAP